MPLPVSAQAVRATGRCLQTAIGVYKNAAKRAARTLEASDLDTVAESRAVLEQELADGRVAARRAEEQGLDHVRLDMFIAEAGKLLAEEARRQRPAVDARARGSSRTAQPLSPTQSHVTVVAASRAPARAAGPLADRLKAEPLMGSQFSHPFFRPFSPRKWVR